MSSMDAEPTVPMEPSLAGDTQEGAGFLHIEEKQEDTTTGTAPTPATSSVQLSTPVSLRSMERIGTAEHLAARRPVPALDATTAEIKERLTALRTDVTRLVTGLRWGGSSVDETLEQIVPLLNIGPIPQWRPVLIPFLFEIDRAGNLIPVWLKLIEHSEPSTPPHVNPAETPQGRARRYAILMLGNYKTVDLSDRSKMVGFAKGVNAGNTKAPEFMKVLRKLAGDPATSLYATQALAKQGTTAAIQILVSTLKDAEGWAKVDVVEACLSLNQTGFYDLLVASGLDHVPGLESYVAIPIYRTIPLNRYLRGDNETTPRLSQQAALLFAQVIQESTTLPKAGANELPTIFEGKLSETAYALFEGARRTPNWQYALALHRLGVFLGRYWSEISRGAIQDSRILDPIYATLPMMPEVERWMSGPGRDVLLNTLTDADEETFSPIVKVLGDLRDPRATSVLLPRLETPKELVNRQQALSLATTCDTLARLGDRRAVAPMLQLVERVVNLQEREDRPKRRDNLPDGDAGIPGSIVCAAVLRACGQLEDRSALDYALRATADFDPYVRTQALDALKRIDPAGSDMRTRLAVRTALSDPRPNIVRSACQLVVQYHDGDAAPQLHQIVEARSELSPTAYDTLRQMGM